MSIQELLVDLQRDVAGSQHNRVCSSVAQYPSQVIPLTPQESRVENPLGSTPSRYDHAANARTCEDHSNPMSHNFSSTAGRQQPRAYPRKEDPVRAHIEITFMTFLSFSQLHEDTQWLKLICCNLGITLLSAMLPIRNFEKIQAIEASAHIWNENAMLVVRTPRGMHVPEVLVGTSPESW